MSPSDCNSQVQRDERHAISSEAERWIQPLGWECSSSFPRSPLPPDLPCFVFLDVIKVFWEVRAAGHLCGLLKWPLVCHCIIMVFQICQGLLLAKETLTQRPGWSEPEAAAVWAGLAWWGCWLGGAAFFLLTTSSVRVWGGPGVCLDPPPHPAGEQEQRDQGPAGRDTLDVVVSHVLVSVRRFLITQHSGSQA